MTEDPTTRRVYPLTVAVDEAALLAGMQRHQRMFLPSGEMTLERAVVVGQLSTAAQLSEEMPEHHAALRVLMFCRLAGAVGIGPLDISLALVRQLERTSDTTGL